MKVDLNREDWCWDLLVKRYCYMLIHYVFESLSFNANRMFERSHDAIIVAFLSFTTSLAMLSTTPTVSDTAIANSNTTQSEVDEEEEHEPTAVLQDKSARLWGMLYSKAHKLK